MTNEGFDFAALLGAATEMQSQLSAQQDRVAQQQFIGSAGGNRVNVTITGAYEAVALDLSESVLAEGAEFVADLVLAALRDALRQVGAAHLELSAAVDPSSLLGAFGSFDTPATPAASSGGLDELEP